MNFSNTPDSAKPIGGIKITINSNVNDADTKLSLEMTTLSTKKDSIKQKTEFQYKTDHQFKPRDSSLIFDHTKNEETKDSAEEERYPKETELNGSEHSDENEESSETASDEGSSDNSRSDQD